MEMKEKYKLEIIPISPIHIGTGDEIIYFSKNEQKIVVKDVERFIKEWQKLNAEEKYQIIKDCNADAIPQEKYTLGVSFNLKAENVKRIREFNKTIDFKPYIPGTAIKAGLRTAFLSYLLNDQNVSSQVKNKIIQDILPSTNISDKYADDEIDRYLMGDDPQKDIFKSIQISDSKLFDIEKLKVIKIQIFNVKHNSNEWMRYKIFVEAINNSTDVLTETTLTIDKYFLSQNDALLGKNKDKINIDTLIKAAKMFTNFIINYEKNFYKNKNEVRNIYNFYNSILTGINNNLGDNEFLLPIGWGTGWVMKTISSMLMNWNDFRKIKSKFKLGKPTLALCSRHNEPLKNINGRLTFCSRCNRELRREEIKYFDVFPKTRKIAFIDNTTYPLGWIKIKITKL
jgi:CRISPR type III-A-associated RAMP protein Csm5